METGGQNIERLRKSKETYAHNLVVVYFLNFAKCRSQNLFFSFLFEGLGGFKKAREACRDHLKHPPWCRVMTKKRKSSRLINSGVLKFECMFFPFL